MVLNVLLVFMSSPSSAPAGIGAGIGTEGFTVTLTRMADGGRSILLRVWTLAKVRPSRAAAGALAPMQVAHG